MPEKVNLAEYYKHSNQKPQTSPGEKSVDTISELTKEERADIAKEIDTFFNNEQEENEDYDEKFDFLLEQLELVGLGSKKDEIEDNLIDEIYENKTKTIKEACAELENIIKKRKESMLYLRAGISITEKNQKVIETRLNLVENIDYSTLDQTLFLGSGNIARVYKLSDMPGLCVKKIVNDSAYVRENSVAQEGKFLNDLSEFEVEGVRTPHILNTISGGGLTVIVMEELDAVNFELAANGKAHIPENFDFEDYFKRLHAYVTAMHKEKGIAHKDLAPRNIMICNKTGRPFVIDFGRSEYLADSKNQQLSCDKDFAGIEVSKSMMRKFLRNTL